MREPGRVREPVRWLAVCIACGMSCADHDMAEVTEWRTRHEGRWHTDAENPVTLRTLSPAETM